MATDRIHRETETRVTCSNLDKDSAMATDRVHQETETRVTRPNLDKNSTETRQKFVTRSNLQISTSAKPKVNYFLITLTEININNSQVTKRTLSLRTLIQN